MSCETKSPSCSRQYRRASSGAPEPAPPAAAPQRCMRTAKERRSRGSSTRASLVRARAGARVRVRVRVWVRVRVS